MRRASYHNHTRFSDGADSPADFLRQALPQGIDILGFSDHYYRRQADDRDVPDWALAPDAEEAYFDTLAALAAEAPIEIRVGLEFDWLEGSAAWLAAPARDPRLDYAIGSVHFLGDQTLDTDRAVKAAGMVVELNTSGWAKDCRECYPSEAILRACFAREIPVTVSADAHRASLATANFPRAYDLLARVGYRALTRFRGRERLTEPLEP